MAPFTDPSIWVTRKKWRKIREEATSVSTDPSGLSRPPVIPERRVGGALGDDGWRRAHDLLEEDSAEVDIWLGLAVRDLFGTAESNKIEHSHRNHAHQTSNQTIPLINSCYRSVAHGSSISLLISDSVILRGPSDLALLAFSPQKIEDASSDALCY